METPCYVYDLNLLESTVEEVIKRASKFNYNIHFAIKSNTDVRINEIISDHGLGVDCVSGNEILHAIKCGYKPENIVFAGVGKTDKDINTALINEIGCFNIESFEEVGVINSLAREQGKIARLAVRVNPDVNAQTHEYITTGLNENKFGISCSQLMNVIDEIEDLSYVDLTGLHFHIGSQITNMDNFISLCNCVNVILEELKDEGIYVEHLNMGGGLGIDYDDPDANPIPDFDKYFRVFNDHLHIEPHQKVHFELGRSIVGQCGNLYTQVLYVKEGVERKFAIVDAGMTDLIRPALYKANHKIEKHHSSDQDQNDTYDVVGPICESSDVFAKDIKLPVLKRGDRLVIRSVGAYGEVMCSNYNLRNNPNKYYIERAINESKEDIKLIELAFPTYLSLKNTLSREVIMQ